MLGFIIVGNSTVSAQLIDIPAPDTLAAVGAKKKIFISPVLGYTPETRLYFGAGGVYYLPPSKKYPNSNSSVVKVVFVYTLNKQIESNIAGESYFKNDLFKLNYSTSYYKFPDYFFGIGNNTEEDDKEKFDYNFFNIFINAQRKIKPNFYAGFKSFYEYSKVYDTTPGGFFDTQKIPGEQGGNNTGLGLWLTYDTRDNIYFPLNGINIDASSVVHTDLLGSDYNYVDFTAEISQFKKIQKDDVIAFNLYGKFLPGDPPFNRMAQLGGDTHMRGNYEGRFRDNNYLTIQGEYRVTFWKYFGITVFGGLGEVAENFSAFSTAGLKYSIGAGGRLFIIPKDKLSLRLDYGFGSDGNSGFYVSFREAF